MSHQRRETLSGPRQVFRCQSSAGEVHYFSVIVAADTGAQTPVWSPPPACQDHPDGHVVRDGRYAKSSARPRQRYRCYPDPSDREKFHRFVPSLPREHVHRDGQSCGVCEELRGIHRGETAVSRRQSWPVRVVAETLRDLARGSSYAAASKRAKEATGRSRTRQDRQGKSSESRRVWHIAADWVETFGPVLYEHVEAQLRAEAAQAVAERDRHVQAGTTNPAPVVVVIDDQPVFAKNVAESGKRGGRPDWSVLVLSEVRWAAGPFGLESRTQRLRLVRALPSNDHLAWKLVFDELGYEPDYVVSDSDDGQIKAVEEFWPNATFIPSLYHVRLNVTEALFDSPGTFTRRTAKGTAELRGEFRDHLAKLSRDELTAMTVSQWAAWWDHLEARIAACGAPVEPVRKRRGKHEAPIAALLPTFAATPQLPMSTGGLEVAIRQRIEPLLEGRGHAFGNLERTNRLFDLVVCDAAGLFHDLGEVVRLLREDTRDSYGWGTPLREVADRQPPPNAGAGRYRSLRDSLLLRDVARTRKLS